MRSSVTRHATRSDSLVDQTIKVWQPLTEHKLAREDARRIIENTVGFFSLLSAWAGEGVDTACNTKRRPVARTDEEARHEC